VLEPAGDRAVVLGCREEDRVRRSPGFAQALHRLGRVMLEVLIVERQLAETFPELELDAVGRGLERSPQEARVERALPQAAGAGDGAAVRELELVGAERDLGMPLGVEEVRRLEMAGELLVLHVDARDACRTREGRALECGVEVAEAAAEDADAGVLDLER